MDPIQLLMDEHKIIEKGLTALENFATQVRAKGWTDRQLDLATFVDFIQQFADRTHHGKEEDILFKAMTDNGFPRNTGPIAVMLAEHEEGRAQVRVLKSLSEKKGAWDSREINSVLGASMDFVNLLRQHIMKEDTILYPMVKAHLPAEILAEIAEGCAKFEENERKKGEHERLRALAADLDRRFGKN